MTIAIQPLPPIGTLPPISTLPPLGQVSPAAAPAGVKPAPGADLVDLFRSKFDAARMAPPDASRVHGPSVLTEAVTREDKAFAQLGGHVDRFAVEAPQMSPQELVAATTKIQFEAAQMACKMYGGQMVAQGVKTSVQTLMKNQ